MIGILLNKDKLFEILYAWNIFTLPSNFIDNMAGSLVSLLVELIYLISFAQIIALLLRVIWGEGTVEREKYMLKYVRMRLVVHLNWLEDWNEMKVKCFVLKWMNLYGIYLTQKKYLLNTAFHINTASGKTNNFWLTKFHRK